MDTEDLSFFARVVRRGSISAAGRDIGLSAATASARLIALERRLGVRLLHRNTRGATITEDGAAFLPYVEAILEATEIAMVALGGGKAEPRGTIRIAAPSSFGRMHLVPQLPALLARYPGLELDLRLSDTVVDLVEGAFDLAIRNAAPADSSLIGRKLAPDRRQLVAAPSYLARRGVPTDPSQLLAHECLVLGALNVWTLATPRGAQSIKVGGRVRIDDGAAVRDAAVAGLGITLMSTWAAGEAVRRGELVVVLPAFPVVTHHAIWALYPSSRLLSPKVRVVIDHLAECFGPSPYWDEL